MTGSWEEPTKRLQKIDLATHWRPFRIAKIVQESATVRSLHLEPADGLSIIAHQPGQHLPIRVKIDGIAVSRPYTISSAPSDGFYRLSFKPEGRVSRFLYGLRIGDMIEVMGPAGQFVIDAREKRPAVLIGAGIGISPMIAMARHIVNEGFKTRHFRPTWLIQAARSKADRVFDGEISDFVTTSRGAVRAVRVLSDPSAAPADFDYAGRVDMKLLSAVLPFGDYDFYLCGPTGFIQSIHDGLRGLNIAEERIHAEAFGPSELVRGKAACPPPARRACP